jgi:hypothetical protein
MVATSVGTLRSLVARTSRCGEGISFPILSCHNNEVLVPQCSIPHPFHVPPLVHSGLTLETALRASVSSSPLPSLCFDVDPLPLRACSHVVHQTQTRRGAKSGEIILEGE